MPFIGQLKFWFVAAKGPAVQCYHEVALMAAEEREDYFIISFPTNKGVYRPRYPVRSDFYAG